MSGIPGTIGGAVFCNAGGFGYEMSKFIKKVKTIDLKTYKEKTYLLKDCKFNYRDSIFKKNREIVWEAELFIKKGDKAKTGNILREKSKDYWEYKFKKGLFRYPSAGSIFKNIFSREIPKKYTKEAKIKGGKISTGWFIEKCNLKGKKYGGAMISDFHANVIVNFNNAKAKDVLHLINICKRKVYKKFKIKLKEEIIIVNSVRNKFLTG